MIVNSKIGDAVTVGAYTGAPIGIIVSEQFENRYSKTKGLSVRVFIPGSGIEVFPCEVLYVAAIE